jgi:hypothetical protein
MMLGRWGTEGLARIQNDHPEYRKVKYTDKDYFLINNEEVKVLDVCKEPDSPVSCEPYIESVYEKIPATFVSLDTLLVMGDEQPQPFTWQEGYRKIKTDPLKTLGFYENSKLLNLFDSFRKNLLAITLLNLVSFLMLFIFLKNKDKI